MKSKDTFFHRVKYYFSICCISFTILELVISVLHITGIFLGETTWMNNIEMFTVCFCIGILIFITDIFTKNTREGYLNFFQILVHLFDVSLSVFGLGGLVFHWFSWEDILGVFGILSFIYFVVYGIMILNQKISANMINKEIIRRKEENKNGRKDN